MSGPICHDLEERCWKSDGIKKAHCEGWVRGIPVRQLRLGSCRGLFESEMAFGKLEQEACLGISLSTLTLIPLIHLPQRASSPEPSSLSFGALGKHQNKVQNCRKLSIAKLNPEPNYWPHHAASASLYFKQMY